MWGYLPAVQVLWTQENRDDLGAGGSPCSARGHHPSPSLSVDWAAGSATKNLPGRF